MKSIKDVIREKMDTRLKSGLVNNFTVNELEED